MTTTDGSAPQSEHNGTLKVPLATEDLPACSSTTSTEASDSMNSIAKQEGYSFELPPMEGIGSNTWNSTMKGISSKDFEPQNGDTRTGPVESTPEKPTKQASQIESEERTQNDSIASEGSSGATSAPSSPTSQSSTFPLSESNPQLHRALSSNPSVLMQFAKQHLTQLRNATAQIRPSEPESLKLLHVQILSLFNELYQVESSLHKTQGKIKNVKREYSEVVGMVQREREEKAALRKEVKQLKERRVDLEKARSEMLSVLKKVGLFDEAAEVRNGDVEQGPQHAEQRTTTESVTTIRVDAPQEDTMETK